MSLYYKKIQFFVTWMFATFDQENSNSLRGTLDCFKYLNWGNEKAFPSIYEDLIKHLEETKIKKNRIPLTPIKSFCLFAPNSLFISVFVSFIKGTLYLGILWLGVPTLIFWDNDFISSLIIHNPQVHTYLRTSATFFKSEDARGQMRHQKWPQDDF